MNNIHDSKVFVKLISLLEMASEHECIDFREGQPLFGSATPHVRHLPQARCPFHIPASLAMFPNGRDSAAQKASQTDIEWEALQSELRLGAFSDGQMHRFIQCLSRKRTVMFQKNADGRLCAFEGRQKGTRRYNKKYSFQIMDAIAEMQNRGMETYFLTMTCDAKEYGTDVFMAWYEYSRKLMRFFKNLSRRFGAVYTWVKESTKKGYPHVHCVIGMPRGGDSVWQSAQNKDKVFCGSLYEYVKKHAPAPVFDLEVAKGERLKFYLTKYISKSGSQDIFRLAPHNVSFSDSQRKDVQGLAYTCLTKTRQFGLSRCLVKKEDSSGTAAPQSGNSLNLDAEYQKVKRMWFEAEDRRFFDAYKFLLTSLCTNYPFSCKNSLRFSTWKQISTFKDFDFEQWDSLDTSKKLDFGAKCTPFGCGGCFFSAFADFVVNHRTDLLMSHVGRRGQNFIGGISPDVWQDSELFYYTVGYIWDCFCSRCVGGVQSFAEVSAMAEKTPVIHWRGTYDTPLSVCAQGEAVKRRYSSWAADL